MQKINSCLWFNNQAEEAVKLYVSLFKNSKIGKVARYSESGAKVSGQKKDAVMTIEFKIAEQTIIGLNGGPLFKFTPAISFFVWCESEDEINELWEKLSSGGTVRMGLDKYPWAQKYGWTTDKFGVEWQFMLAIASHPKKIAPAMLFVKSLFGKGEEAINFYVSLFKNSKIESLTRDEATKTVINCVFSLANQEFVLMEGQGPHDFSFSPAFSFIVNCETQKEVDGYWQKLSEGGSIEQCGWLKDKFGISWQIVPTALGKMMSDPDSAKSERVMAAMLKMKKLDIKILEQAYDK